MTFAACSRELPPAWRAWVVSHHHPLRSLTDTVDLSDLAVLDDLVSGRRIVQLGENGHGVAEFNQIKVRIIRYLHERLGFNVVAFESNFFACLDVDDRITGLPVASGPQAGCPTGVWHTDEVLSLLSYAEHTRLSSAPLHIVGFDIIPAPGLRRQGEYFRRLIQPVNPSYAAAVARFDSTNVDRLLAEDSAHVVRNEDRMVATYQELATFFAAEGRHRRSDSDHAVQWSRAAQAARSMAAFVQVGAADLEDHHGGAAAYLRDSAMAANLVHLAEEVFPKDRIVVWAHNGHVRNGGERVTPFRAKSMGQWLVEWNRAQVFTLGLFMAAGTASNNNGRVYDVEPPGARDLESILRSAGPAWHMLDLSTPRQPGTEWAYAPRIARRDGTREERFVPAEQYDAVLFVETVTPARRRHLGAPSDAR